MVCGPAGTGKTFGILSFLHCLNRDYAGIKGLFLRATRVSLTDSVLSTFEGEVLPADGCEFVAEGAQRRNRTHYRYPNGSEIVCAGLDRSPTRVLSTSWDWVFVNEAREVNQEVWETIGSRMDRPDRDTRFGFLLGDSNPGAPDHHLKRRADSAKLPLWDTTHRANPALFDGRNWTPAGLRYLARLDGLTGVRRKRYLDGLWVAGEGIWFDTFDPDLHVTERAEFDPNSKVFVAVDSGVFTGAVWFQVVEGLDGPAVHVFADYLTEGLSAYSNAKAILEVSRERCGGRIHRATTDPAGTARNAVGPAVVAEYARAGLNLIPWPRTSSVVDGLALVESFVGGSLDGPPAALFVHPRCRSLIDAFSNYTRAKVRDVWLDYPADPQHPAEDLIDALRGGLSDRFPDGRRPALNLPTVPASRLV